MIFNSLDFAIFLPIVFVLYWWVNKNLKLQNLLIVIASYIFYAWWDWRFLSLIVFSTLVDYLVGLTLHTTQNKTKRKALLWTSVLVNLGFLGFFKYYNFFIDNFVTAFSFFGTSINPSSLDIILPVGISFYTFQTLSYSIDVYKRKLEPTKDIIAFAAFVSFFPQLVAGPIERATNLLPQFYTKRKFEYAKAVDGLRQILWGLFKKVVIADNCAEYANEIFNHSTDYAGSTLFIGALFFTFQIYADFSGYSDIAIGTSRLFGINLNQNFAFPLFSRNFKEFWRRWHISLTLWLRDYLYIPLGGNRGSNFIKLKNIFLIFIIVGFWHGANWTFIVFGALHAVYYLPFVFVRSKVSLSDTIGGNNLFPNFKDFSYMMLTFILFSLSLILFRAENVSHAFSYFAEIFSYSFFNVPEVIFTVEVYTVMILILIFLLIEWLGRENLYAIEYLGSNWNRPLRYSLYYALIIALFMFAGNKQEFIYFQF